MPKSYFQMYGHLIFSTKNRVNWLDDEIRERVHGYMATIFCDMDCPFVKIGGATDHIHVLFNIGKTNLPVKVIQNIKKETSKFIKTIDDKYCDFSWQKGYGLFSVSPKDLDSVKNYINIQMEHHKKMSFQYEYRLYLEKYKIDYDEKYIWD